MIEFAYIGRNTKSKGLSDVIDIFSEIEAKLNVFSNFEDACPANIVKHGWIDREEIWKIPFNFVILPMHAPETYCFALHEAVCNGRGLVVNGKNESLTQQIASGAHIYYGKENMRNMILQLMNAKFLFNPPVLFKTKTLWERI